MSKSTSKGSNKAQKSSSTGKKKSRPVEAAEKKSKAVAVAAVDNAPVIGEPSAPVEAMSRSAVAAVSASPASDPKPARQRRTTSATYVALEKLLAIVEESGLKADEKKAWLRIDGPNGSRVYVPRRKHVGRIDIAGMSAPEGTSVKLGDKSFGAVKEQLDMEAPEERVLENFRAVLKHMASLPAEEPKPRRKAKIVVEGVEVQA